MKRLLTTFSIILITCSLLLACNKRQELEPVINIKTDVLPKPHKTGISTIHLTLTDGFGKPVNKAQLTLEGNMSHPGMTPVFANAVDKGNGHYEATLNFSMGGDWIVLVFIKLADGKQLERQFDVKNVRSQ